VAGAARTEDRGGDRRAILAAGGVSTARGRLRSVAVLGGGTVLAALFGLTFQSLLSYYFGAGATSDAWFMSLSIFGFLGKFLMLTHMKSIALPIYRSLEERDPAAARLLLRRLLVAAGTGVAGLVVLAVVAAPLLVDLLAPGYHGAQREVTATLLRIRAPALVFLATTSAGLVATESAHRYGVTVSAQKLVPAAVTLLLFAVVGERFGIVGLGWIGLTGGVAGGLVALAAVAPLLGRRTGGSSGRATDDRVRARLGDIGRQWVRFSASNAATFVGEWAFRVAASLLPVGLFSAVLYGRMVHDLLHGAVNDSAQTVSLPRFAAAAAGAPGAADGGAAAGAPGAPGAADVPALIAARVGSPLRESLGLLASATVPIAGYLVAAAPWIVALLFGRGRFLADGMMGPSALALRIFALGFIVQGLNQLLFAGAFASGRSGLVNRVQIIGHLFRAAVLVPAVLAFSFVGLVSAQVAMNVVVLGLLLLMAPAAWGLRPADAIRRALRRRGALGVLLATAVPCAVWLGVLPWLPPPLSLAAAGRLGAVAALGVGWFGLYAVTGGVLGVPTVRTALGRLRPRAFLVVALLVVAGAAWTPRGGVAQQAGPETDPGWSPLPHGHWARDVLELLEARGDVPVGRARFGALPGTLAARLLAGAEEGSTRWAAPALERLREELGAADSGAPRGWLSGGVARRSATLNDHGGIGGENVGGRLDDGLIGGVGLRVGAPGDRFFGALDLRAGPGVPTDRFLRGGIGARLGAFWIEAGRERLQLGGGRGGGLVLSSAAALDGVLIETPRPFSLPIIGRAQVALGVFSGRRYQGVENPWFGLMRLTLRPRRWLQVGLSRAALVGGRFGGGRPPFDPVTYGPDASSMSVGDVLGILLGKVTEFDDQVFSFDVRAGLSGVGIPALAYAEIGLEDKDRSWGDGAVLAGVLVSPAAALPLSVRY